MRGKVRQHIRGLTLHRPWGHAIAYLGKDIENRSWKCTLPVGSFIAIHNGRKWDRSGAEYLKSRGYSFPSEENDLAGAIIAIANFEGNTTEPISPWHQSGSIGWELANIVAIEPVFCRGQQGLWSIVPEILEAVRTNYTSKINGRTRNTLQITKNTK